MRPSIWRSPSSAANRLITALMRPDRHLEAGVFALVLTVAVMLGCATRDTPNDAEPIAVEPVTTSDATAQSAKSDAAATSEASATAADGSHPRYHPDENPDLLTDWGQLTLLDGRLEPAVGVTPYELNSALFSDHAQKLRTIWLPDGAPPATYDSEATFDFPVGTVITKTFWYPSTTEAADRVRTARALSGELQTGLETSAVRLVETRVLVHRADGWAALPYVWNEDQTEATLQRTGDLQRLTLVDEASGDETEFPYVVPNVNQCAGCHATNHTDGAILPIGPKARHLNRTVDFGDGTIDQLDHWRALGLLDGGPASSEAPKSPVWNDPDESLDARARAYLDINCSHCHNTNGPADTSGLFLEPDNPLDSHLGICKPPVAAGTGTGDRRFGINPGRPEDSIFVFRMQTTDPASMMPELGRAVPHVEGIDLVSEWIASLDGSCS